MIAASPRGFRESKTGLLVPEGVSREREVWTRDEWKLLDRATKLLESRGMELYIGCNDPQCKAAPVERLRQPGGEMVLRCGHKDRIFTKAL